MNKTTISAVIFTLFAAMFAAAPALAQGMMGYGGDAVFFRSTSEASLLDESRTAELMEKMRNGTLTEEEMDEISGAMGVLSRAPGAGPMMFTASAAGPLGGTFDCPIAGTFGRKGYGGMGSMMYGNAWDGSGTSVFGVFGMGFTAFLLWTFLAAGAWAFVAFAKGRK